MNRAASLALSPLALLYGAAMRTRAAFYKRGIFRAHKIDAPVISVGNLTTGGTGKTPVVEWIAERLHLKEQRVCVLTRGYRRTNPKTRVVVSDGSQILADASSSGDEALMLAEELRGQAAVICDADRVSAARWAIENFGSNVFVLDDAFQNLRIDRDLNIVTVDATNPWGNKSLLPAGTLREPLKSLSRADCIILTRSDEATDPVLLQQLATVSAAPVFFSRMVTSRIRPLASDSGASATNLSEHAGVAAFCAVGNPQSFFAHVRRESLRLLSTKVFRDHHRYTQTDLDRICEDAIACGAEALITTRKDEVKLRTLRLELPCYVLGIEIEIASADRLLELIDRAILKK